VIAAAFAAARSPWPSCAQMPRTPIGAMNRGEGQRWPNSSMLMSRFEPSTIMRGIRPQRSNAATFAF
jgi:hypothetical protein